MTIPIFTLVCMFISLLVSVGTPVALFFVWRKKYGLRLVPLLVGAAAFVVFALVLEQWVHSLVLAPGSASAALLAAQPLLYTLYGCFMAGIFEETARFLSFTLLKRRFSGLGTALSYGIGHGGIEAILLVGITMLNNIILVFMLNSGSAPANLPAGTAAALAATPAFHFLLAGLERLAAITAHIAMSVVVYYATTGKGRLWLWPLSILLHACLNFPAGLMQAGVLQNVYVVEGLVVVLAVALACVARLVHKKCNR